MEKDLISKDIAEGDLASSREIALNDSGTCAESGAELTQPRSADVPKFADHSVEPGTWGHTYFVQRRKRIKIGHSGAPHQRLDSLGKPLKVLAIIPNTIISERDAHAKFAHLRVKGEWFRTAPELYAFIKEVRAKAIELQKSRPTIDLSFEDTRRALIAKREAHGSTSEIGRTCSTLVEQLENMRTYVRPAWATYEMQTLPFRIGLQMKRLAELEHRVLQ